MEFYGLGLVALCMFIGETIGTFLGTIIGIGGDIGGVGFAMLLLLLFGNLVKLDEKTSRGITFLSAIYIPIIVAMSSIQNVVAAIKGGPVALLAGLLATVASVLLVPIISGVALPRKGRDRIANEHS